MITYGLLHIGKTGGTAAKTVLEENNNRGTGEFVKCFKHKIGLKAVSAENLCDRLLFFVREPTSRYISAFNSRLRKGQPRHFFEWSHQESIAFSRFNTPNELAEALSSERPARQNAARAAMGAIRHLRLSYKHYLGSIELLEKEKKRIYFIGCTEHFDQDFDVLKRIIRVAPDLELPTDELKAHRTPTGFEQAISDLAEENVRKYFTEDYEIYNWCVARRQELLSLRLNELEL